MVHREEDLFSSESENSEKDDEEEIDYKYDDSESDRLEAFKPECCDSQGKCKEKEASSRKPATKKGKPAWHKFLKTTPEDFF